MAPTTLELIRRGAAQHGPRTAIAFGGQSLTFAEVDALSARLAHALQAAGAAPGERVALLLNNGLHSVPLDFACVKAALNRVPLNARLALAEHQRMLQDTGCRMLVFGPDLAERAQALHEALPELACLGLGTSLEGGADLLAAAQSQPATDPQVQVAEDDVILTLFTSGTTGTLKAARHTQASYAAICRNVLLNLLPATPDDVMLHAASLIHASGVFVLPFWLRGGKTVILPGFEPASFLAAIERERVTAINLVPTMLQMLVSLPAMAACKADALRYVIYGASPMPRTVIERAMAIWGQHRFWQYYGQTEAPLCLAVLRPEDHHGERLGACGQVALEVEMRLLDEAGRDVPPGQPGEIAIRAPFGVAGYHNAPELTAQTFLPGGWVRTRDIGVFDADGFLHLKDRTSDMIVSGGYNVYPGEVENALLTHPAVHECAVIGLPDEKWVEAVTAVVVLHAGQAASDALAAELVQHVAAQFAAYKKPRRVLFASELPKTAVGKMNRRALRERYRDAAQAGQAPQ
ncbi:fatty-acid--CoA ligase [Cupriavidus basilensis OR16]|uniref:Fatty-acid--CoA ligase n=1 Tax=Cupriavidus basilensis OR16 TaxID=1127483 RepID=H1S6P0_9BURK|nr:AMP-binding protein [Cupriavidus basilensis]EHP41701.1 fatty-acid--CoA ligase [Cupriavidus basilensis OR16]